MSKIKSAMQMVQEANDQVECIDVEQAKQMLANENILFVDIRDIRELWREGTIPDAISAPRGMLEFWFDPSNKYHRKDFADREKIVLFCASAWRSALAAKNLQEMGFGNIAHLAGGFSAWKAADGEVKSVEKR